MELISGIEPFKQGAEGRISLGEYLGKKVLIKERFPKKYRHPALDAQLTKDRLRGEVRSLLRCHALGIRTPTLYLADQGENIIVMEYFAEAKTARDVIKEGGSGDRRVLNDLCAKIGLTLGQLHKNGIIHGDLTTSNLLVLPEGDLVVIDFGLGSAEGSSLDKGVDLYVLERAFLSTHPGTEDLFEVILQSYKREMATGSKKEAAEVVAKYEDIRMRGRKRTMVG